MRKLFAAALLAVGAFASPGFAQDVEDIELTCTMNGDYENCYVDNGVDVSQEVDAHAFSCMGETWTDVRANYPLPSMFAAEVFDTDLLDRRVVDGDTIVFLFGNEERVITVRYSMTEDTACVIMLTSYVGEAS